MKLAISLTALIIIVLLPACVNEETYTNTRRNELKHCLSVPTAQYEECMKQIEDNKDD